jgi:hypothetical protein
VALIQRGRPGTSRSPPTQSALGAHRPEPTWIGLLLAVAAIKLQNRVETRSDLAALERAALIRVLRPSDHETVANQVSPDGRLLATAVRQPVRFIDRAAGGCAAVVAHAGLSAIRNELLARRPRHSAAWNRRSRTRRMYWIDVARDEHV